MPWIEDLVTVLENDSVAIYGSTLFKSTKAAPALQFVGSAVLVLIPTGGSSPERTQNDDVLQPPPSNPIYAPGQGRPATIRPGAQVVAKAADYDSAEALARLAYTSLVRIGNQWINSGWYKSIDPLNEPFDGGLDARGNAQCKFNIIGRVGQRPW